MKILNLYAGIGGNRKLWGDEHQVTAVEIDPEIAAVYQQLYPNDTVIVTDAHQYLLDHYKEFDFIWSSPPCPTHSRLQMAQKKKSYPDMMLWQEIIFLRHNRKYTPWVVENVIPYYEPLTAPTVEIARHYFWSNKPIDEYEYEYEYPFRMLMSNIRDMQRIYGITLPLGTKNKRKLLRNAVIPEIGLHIFKEATK